ncbi:hypothetical protein BJ878DRAFT_488250 [Calycina marina]|uniref:Uncharacterized protein n=1 Tax=Calycina marina TaxID=1763456 RepID=A0A9P7ZAD9_9HELO|nr:hypothetical protein BJ878DRAFT_488250 [Calycina marina]
MQTLESRITAPRGPRNPNPSTRTGGSHRSGIQKRSSTPRPRVDKDGDLVMDSDATKSGKGGIERVRGRGAGRGRAASTRASNPGRSKAAVERGISTSQVNLVNGSSSQVQVDGLHGSKAVNNPDGGLEALCGFLERKAAGLDAASNRVVKIKKSQLRGGSVFLTASAEDIAEILKLNGFKFAGSDLVIKEVERKDGVKEPSAQAQGVKERMKAALSKRYDSALKLLNLSDLVQDPDLQAVDISVLSADNVVKFFSALMQLFGDMLEENRQKRNTVTSISIANNGLDTVSNIYAIGNTFPHLKNLDLSGNNFASTKSLEGLKHKFRSLENLVLTNNPIVIQEPAFGEQVISWLPKLLLLNEVPVRTPEQVFATSTPIPISTPDFRDVGQVGETFIRALKTNYDGDRNALLAAYYDDQSVFSLAINMTAPRNREHITPVPAWSAYTKFNHNLDRINHTIARMNRRFVGVQAIQATWAELPATRHPNLNQSDKYIIECRPQAGLPDPSGRSSRGVDGLLITVHGEFEEQNSKVEDRALRSFSRTFVLGPGVPGGVPIRVISDMMALRAHAPLAHPSPAVVQAQAAQIQEPAQQQTPTDQEKEFMANQLMEKTGMTLEYTIMCLQDNTWNLEQAYMKFQTVEPSLPPIAFINGVVPK